MKYAYVIDDEKLSEEFSNIKELIASAVENIGENNFPIVINGMGNRVLKNLEVVETETVDYEINGKEIIHQLKDKACSDFGDVDWYLDDVNIKDFNKKINKFWKEYVAKNNIKEIITERNKTKRYFDVYVRECNMSYNLATYVEKEGNINDENS